MLLIVRTWRSTRGSSITDFCQFFLKKGKPMVLCHLKTKSKVVWYIYFRSVRRSIKTDFCQNWRIIKQLLISMTIASMISNAQHIPKAGPKKLFGSGYPTNPCQNTLNRRLNTFLRALARNWNHQDSWNEIVKSWWRYFPNSDRWCRLGMHGFHLGYWKLITRICPKAWNVPFHS